MIPSMTSSIMNKVQLKTEKRYPLEVCKGLDWVPLIHSSVNALNFGEIMY